MNHTKTAKTAFIISSTAFILTLTSYIGLNPILQTQETYYLGIATLSLLFPLLVSVAYIMAVTAKHTLDEGIETLRTKEELKCPITQER